MPLRKALSSRWVLAKSQAAATSRRINKDFHKITYNQLVVIIGIVLVSSAVILIYPIYLYHPKTEKLPIGITILSTGPLPESLNEFTLLVYDISASDSRATGELFVNLNLSDSSSSGYHLKFVIPHEVLDAQASIPNNRPQSSTSYDQDHGISFVEVHLEPKAEKNLRLTLQFTWKNSVKWDSFSTFNLIIPIGVTNMEVLNLDGSYRIIDPPTFKNTRISISDPEGSRGVLYHPVVNLVHTFNGRLWNSWIVNVKSTPTSPSLAAVKVLYASESLDTIKDLMLFLSGALFSAGVAVLVELLLHNLEKRHYQSTLKSP